MNTRKLSFLIIPLLILISCKSPQDTDSGSENLDPDKLYLLKLAPLNGSSYQYAIQNESRVVVETEEKEVENINKADIKVTYKVKADSNGNYQFSAFYDKLKFTSEKNGEETEVDAANSSFSVNPLEKMLGMLKDSVISITVSPTGDIVSMKGYREIGEKMIAKLSVNDEAGKKAVLELWDQYIGEGLIKKNLGQLFKLFPDSSVKLGDEWKLTEREEGNLKYNLNGYYKLKAVSQDLAIIGSEGKISATGTNQTLAEMGGSISKLTGEQSAEYEIETKTGMVLACRVKASLEGLVVVMNKEVPIKAVVTVNVTGKKVE